MKLKFRIMVVFLIALPAIGLFIFPAWGTDVGGNIDTDTTWDLAGSPYIIKEDILVTEGVTLSIEPGVIVYGQNYKLQIGGTLNANGSSELNIFFTDVNIMPGLFSNTIISINFSEINGGGIFNLGGNTGRGALLLENSKIFNTGDNEPIWIWSPTSDCYIEKNIFLNSSGINIQTDSPPNKIYIRNNVFYNQKIGYDGIYAVRSWGGDTDSVIVEYNSFLDTDRIALRLGYNGNMKAINNFWNTVNPDVIDSMIYDRNDDLTIANYIEYIPFLKEPHPDTPIPDFNQAPTAVFGPDQVVFDEVTLDGKDSYDPDGSIDLYEWKLEYIGDPTHDKTAIGENPTIIDLHPGVYDAYLTVTDNIGAKGMDYALVSAAGTCAISPVADEDEDGEPDITDICADTTPGTDVDSNGCSLWQFCSAIDTSTHHGRRICKHSDWKNDEPLKSRGDCKVVRQGKGPSNYSCVPP